MRLSFSLVSVDDLIIIVTVIVIVIVKASWKPASMDSIWVWDTKSYLRWNAKSYRSRSSSLFIGTRSGPSVFQSQLQFSSSRTSHWPLSWPLAHERAERVSPKQLIPFRARTDPGLWERMLEALALFQTTLPVTHEYTYTNTGIHKHTQKYKLRANPFDWSCGHSSLLS